MNNKSSSLNNLLYKKTTIFLLTLLTGNYHQYKSLFWKKKKNINIIKKEEWLKMGYVTESVEKIVELKKQSLDADVLVHPECKGAVAK